MMSHKKRETVLTPRKPLRITPLDVAQTYIGMREVAGSKSNPGILAMLQRTAAWPAGDDVPWCSAFIHEISRLLNLEQTHSLRARSWLRVGQHVPLKRARPGFDLVVLMRGGGSQPGPDVIDAPGHVGFFVDQTPDGTGLKILGGNQGDQVSIATFPASRLLDIRRL